MKYIVFLIGTLTFIHSTRACLNNNKGLADQLDPELRAMLKQTFNPAGATADIPDVPPIEDRIEAARTRVARTNSSPKSTGFEKAEAQRHLDGLIEEQETAQAQAEFAELLKQPMRPSSSTPSPQARVVASDTDPTEVRLESYSKADGESELDRLLALGDNQSPTTPRGPEAPPKADPEPEIEPLPEPTDEDRALFEQLLKGNINPAATKHPFDEALDYYKYATPEAPIEALYKHPLTGEISEVQVTTLGRTEKGLDYVMAKVTTPDGRTVTRRIKVSELVKRQRDGTIVELDSNLSGSDRFKDTPQSEIAVNRIVKDAMSADDRRQWLAIQKQLDAGVFDPNKMMELVSKQDDLLLKYSPLRQVEVDVITHNIDDLLSKTTTTISEGDRRALEQIHEIARKRSYNAMAVEDEALMRQVEGLTEETLMAKRVQRQRQVIRQNIARVTGSRNGRLPFEKERNWNTRLLQAALKDNMTSSLTTSLRTFDKYAKSTITPINDMEFRNALTDLERAVRSGRIKDEEAIKYIEYGRAQYDLYRLDLK